MEDFLNIRKAICSCFTHAAKAVRTMSDRNIDMLHQVMARVPLELQQKIIVMAQMPHVSTI